MANDGPIQAMGVQAGKLLSDIRDRYEETNRLMEELRTQEEELREMLDRYRALKEYMTNRRSS